MEDEPLIGLSTIILICVVIGFSYLVVDKCQISLAFYLLIFGIVLSMVPLFCMKRKEGESLEQKVDRVSKICGKIVKDLWSIVVFVLFLLILYVLLSVFFGR